MKSTTFHASWKTEIPNARCITSKGLFQCSVSLFCVCINWFCQTTLCTFLLNALVSVLVEFLKFSKGITKADDTKLRSL